MAQARATASAAENLETRYQRGAFQKHMARLRFACKDIPSAKLRLIYEEVTGQQTADGPERSPLLARLQSLLSSPDVAESLAELADFRHENGKEFGYKAFYQATMDFLAQESPTPTAKRTGANVVPFARSAEELIGKVLEFVGSDHQVAVPSTNYFRTWFLPRSVNHKSLGLIPFKRTMVSRSDGAPNEDEHYNNALHKYVRAFACQEKRQYGKDAVAFRSLDDKAKIIVAETGECATSALVRQSTTIVHAEGEKRTLAAHDFTKLSIIPSVELNVRIPSSVVDSFYQGQVTVQYKRAHDEPSSSVRHVAEMLQRHCPGWSEELLSLLYRAQHWPSHVHASLPQSSPLKTWPS